MPGCCLVVGLEMFSWLFSLPQLLFTALTPVWQQEGRVTGKMNFIRLSKKVRFWGRVPPGVKERLVIKLKVVVIVLVSQLRSCKLKAGQIKCEKA